MGHSHRADAKHKKHNALNIRLTESAVFLPVDTFAPSRRHTHHSECRTSTLRGLLVLDLVKPTRISSIDIELTAMTSTAWPEGVGARRIDVTEDHQVFHASTVFFSGSKVPQRRALSIGPGIYSRFGDHLEDDEDAEELEGGWEAIRRQSGPHPHHVQPAPVVQESNNAEAGPSSPRAGAPSPAPIQRESTTSSHSTVDSFSYPEHRRENRRFSVDATHIRSRPPYETRQISRGLSPRELEELAPIPPYSAFPDDSPTPVSANALSPTHADPAHSLEEFRNSLHSNLRSSQPHPSKHLHNYSGNMRATGHCTARTATDSSPTGSASSLLSAPTADTLISRQASTSTSHYDPEPALRIAPAPSPRRRSFSSTRARAERRISQSTSTLPPIQAQDAAPSPVSPATLEKEKESRGRKRFSLTNIFKHAKAGVSRERTHDRERSVDAERPSVVGRVSPESPLEEMEEEDEHRPARSKSRGRGVIGRILRENLIDGGKENEDWTEFKPGTYSYPISFSIPANAPPTMRCEYGSVVWQLRANVHRPGAFKTKLTAVRDVNVIVCPTEEDTEDTENIIVERQWEQQLQYLIAVSGRSFYIGGTMPVMFTLMPLTKMKVFRLSIYIEERVDYYTNMRRIARSDLPTRVCLLSVKGGKGGEPILPLDSDAPDALRCSPLFPVVDPAATEGELSEIASNLMGPGPWTFQQNLPLPKSCDELRFTNKNRRSNIEVSHLLKVVMRVQRGDDEHVDPKTGKRKLFDIVVQTPVVILSCRCNPEWMALPRYAEALEDTTLIVPSCPCQDERARILNGQTGGSFLERMTSRRSSDSSSASAAETTAVHPHSPMSMRRSTYTDAILQSSSLFERLVSGQESVSGEVPPAYDPAVCAPVVNPVLSPPRATGVTAI